MSLDDLRFDDCETGSGSFETEDVVTQNEFQEEPIGGNDELEADVALAYHDAIDADFDLESQNAEDRTWKIDPDCEECSPILGAYNLYALSDAIGILNTGERVLCELDAILENNRFLFSVAVSLVSAEVGNDVPPVNRGKASSMTLADVRKPATRQMQKQAAEYKAYMKERTKFQDAIHKQIKENDNLRLLNVKQERELKAKKKEMKDLKVRMSFLEKGPQQELSTVQKKRMCDIKIEMAAKNVEIHRLKKEIGALDKDLELKAERCLKVESQNSKVQAMGEIHNEDLLKQVQSTREEIESLNARISEEQKQAKDLEEEHKLKDAELAAVSQRLAVLQQCLQLQQQEAERQLKLKAMGDATARNSSLPQPLVKVKRPRRRPKPMTNHVLGRKSRKLMKGKAIQDSHSEQVLKKFFAFVEKILGNHEARLERVEEFLLQA